MNRLKPISSLSTLVPLFLFTAMGCGITAAASLPPAPSTHGFLNVNVGLVGIFDRNGSDWRYGMEYRFKPRTPWQVMPSIGGTTTEHDASYAYLGVRRDFPLDESWLLTPSFDIGFFNENRQLELGSELEFRSGIELLYRLRQGYRLGVALYHLSNGGLGDRNPGTESITVSVSIPMQ